MSISVKKILASHINDVKKNMSWKDKVNLTKIVRAEIKENVGHGISQEYYDKIWKSDKFKVSSISGHIINAYASKGAYDF